MAPRNEVSTCPLSALTKKKDLDAFIEDIKISVQQNTTRFRYSKVTILIMTWENGDSDRGVVRNLRHVFEDRYGFEIVEYKVPAAKDNKSAVRDFSLNLDTTFLKRYDAEGALVIYVYPPSLLNGPDNEWCSTPSIISCCSEGDVLFIFDAPRSKKVPGQAIAGVDQESGPSRELLAASSGEAQIPHDGSPDHTFITALTEQLVFCDGEPRQVSKIYTEIHNSMVQKATRNLPYRLARSEHQSAGIRGSISAEKNEK